MSHLIDLFLLKIFERAAIAERSYKWLCHTMGHKMSHENRGRRLGDCQARCMVDLSLMFFLGGD